MTHPTTIAELATRHRRGDSVVTTIENTLAQISQGNPKVNALCCIAKERSLERAQSLETAIRKGEAGGRLLGVPFIAKDTIDVKGLPRSDGSKASFVPSSAQSAKMIDLLESEGAICIGKGNMAEQGRSYFTDNLLHGRSLNPWNLELTPGGSGGGDAAAVALGLGQFSIGADAGGSIRVPANFCGLFGLYPTPGSIPTTGLSSTTHTWKQILRSHGVTTTSLQDLRVLMRVLFQFDPRDPFSHQRRASFHHPRTRRIALVESVRGTLPDPEIRSALTEAQRRFEEAGWEVVPRSMPVFDATLEPFIFLAGQAALVIDDLIAQEGGRPVDFASESPAMKRLRERIATNLPPLELSTFFRAWYGCHMLRYQAQSLFSEYDCILAPVAATLAMRHGTASFEIGGLTYQSEQVFQFSSMVNLLGLCSIAFPTGVSQSGTPLGLQLIGNRFDEELVIDALESAQYLFAPTCPLRNKGEVAKLHA